MSQLSLEELRSKTFALRLRIKQEVIPLRQRLHAFEEANPEPSWWWHHKKNKEWKVKKEKITEEYYAHPLFKELEKLQNQCPHIFGSWEKDECAPIYQSRVCIICGYEDTRFTDPF